MLTHTRRRELSGRIKFFALLGFLLMGIFDSATDYAGGLFDKAGSSLNNLFNSPQPPPGGTPRERLLNSIRQAEGEDANVPYGYHSEDFLNRTASGEKIPEPEAREAVAGHLERQITLWEANETRDLLGAEERGLTNPNPRKNKAIIDGEWNPDFINWYGEIYAPYNAHPLNKNWSGNVKAGLNMPQQQPQQRQPNTSHKQWANEPLSFPPSNQVVNPNIKFNPFPSKTY